MLLAHAICRARTSAGYVLAVACTCICGHGPIRESRSLLRSRMIISGEVSRRNSEAVATQDFDKSGKRCNTRCHGLYLHLRRRPVGRTDAPPYLPGASRLYGEEAKELELAPVGLARHRTKWPCDQVGPPGPPPAHLSCPLDPWGAGWGEISPPGLPVRAAARAAHGPGGVAPPFSLFFLRAALSKGRRGGGGETK
jgi:hypothetical protein